MLIFLLFFTLAFSNAEIKILEDQFEKFTISINLDAQVKTDANGYIQWDCVECVPEIEHGKANRPYFPLYLGVGDERPTVTIKVLEKYESVTGILMQAMERGTKAKIAPSANALTPVIGEKALFRGVNTRSFLIPMATWNATSKQFVMVKKAQIEVEFNSKKQKNSVLPKIVSSAILNPQGVRQLYKPPLKETPKGLFRSLAKGDVQTSTLVYPYVKIQIGDENVESLSEDGFYRLTFEQVASLFPNVSSVNVSVENLRVLVGDAESLSETPRATVSGGNLREIPVEVRDQGSQGTFDAGDEIIFFAQGTSRWSPILHETPNSLPIQYEFENDEFSFFQYVYLELFGTTLGKRIDTIESLVSTQKPQVESWHYLRAEKELVQGYCDLVTVNDLQVGKIWSWVDQQTTPFNVCRSFVQQITNVPRSVNITIPGSTLVFDEGPLIGYQSNQSIYLGFFTNFGKNDPVFQVTLPEGIPTAVSFPEANGVYFEFTDSVDANFKLQEVNFTINDLNSGLDGYTLIYRRAHIFPKESYYLYPEQAGVSRYALDSATDDFQVLKIQEGIPIHFLKIQENSFVDSIETVQDNVQYFLSRRNTIKNLQVDMLTLENQRLGVVQDFKNTSNQSIEYLIITPDQLAPSALELEQYWEQEHPFKNYRVGVVLLSDIYRHFSSGRVSPVAIRDFIRWAVNGWGGTSLNSDLEFVTLYGDGCYNYRKIPRGLETRERFDDLCLLPPFNKQYMSTDDFYAYLDEGERVSVRGDEVGGLNVDVKLGRLTLATQEEANNYLNKLRNYYNPENYGYWKNLYLSTADDDRQGLQQDFITHTNDAESMALLFQSQDSTKEIQRSYMLNFVHNTAFRKPASTTEILRLINEGALVFNYIGHGDYFLYADESYVRFPRDFDLLNNPFRNFLLTAFSCTVGRFDLANLFGLVQVGVDGQSRLDVSLSEGFLTRSDSKGSIASFAAGRESLNVQNAFLGRMFFQNVLPNRGGGNRSRTLGEAALIAKNSSTSGFVYRNSQKYHLLGEPVLELSSPQLEVNPVNVPDTLGSLACGTISGTITGSSTGQGQVALRIYGQDRDTTISNVVYPNETFSFVPQNFQNDGSLLFSSVVDYANNQFEIPYFLPTNIPLGDTNAVISIFAWDDIQGIDGGFSKTQLHLLGESNTCDTMDNQGPSISLSGCNRSETSLIDLGDQFTIPTPYCLEIILRDSIGGISNAPDQQFDLELENLETRQIILTRKGGEIVAEDGFNVKTFVLQLDTTISSGNYLLRLSGYDGFANKTEREVQIAISNDILYHFIDVFNAPNPIKEMELAFILEQLLMR